MRGLFRLRLSASGDIEAKQITDWKTVFVKRDPQATDRIKQRESEYWTKRYNKISQRLEEYSNMQNTDSMADEAKELMKQMLNSIMFDMMLISKGHKDPHWRRLCDLPFSTKVLYNYYNGYKLMSDTVVSITDNKVKCLFCDEKVGTGHVFTNWDMKAQGKGGCWRQYRNHCSEKHEDFIWYREVRLQLEFSKWEEITVPHILQRSLFDANKIAPISTQHAVSYLKDRDPIPLISCISKQFSHAHSHLTGRATREYFEQVMK